MSVPPADSDRSGAPGFSRRHFLAEAGTAALALSVVGPELARGAGAKVDLGIIGCGGRGGWIADLFQKHGGYNIVAAADYFPDRVNKLGDKLSVPPARRFTGLSAYRRLLEQKLDAVAIETPPFFHPAQAADAVAAGKHVYLAKPVAVDVPGLQNDPGERGESDSRAPVLPRRFSDEDQRAVHRSIAPRA